MIRYAYLSIFLFSSCFSCKQEQYSSLPLTRNELKAVLYDIHLLEASISDYYFRLDSVSPSFTLKYDSILQEHNVSKKDFEYSYKKHLTIYTQELDSIYTDILANYTEMQDSLNNQKKINLHPHHQANPE